LLTGINSGKGSLGKLAKDPALANKVEETVTHLNALLKGLEEGKGSLGQMVVNRSLYDSLDKTLGDTGALVTAIRKDPKTYLTIHVKLF
jgi:phospholipid/cholesterol/gamma-HCH transport system substrate-binding protein